MPQLMPLKWNLSLMMIGFLLIVCYYLYYFKNNVKISFLYDKFEFNKIYWLW